MEKFTTFIKAKEKYLLLSFLALIILIIVGYVAHIKYQQVKKSTYEVYTVKQAAAYQSKGKVDSNSTYTVKVPKDAQLTNVLPAEQAVQKGQQLGTLTFPEKQAELSQVQARISDLQSQLQTQQSAATAQPANSAAPAPAPASAADPTAPATDVPTNSDELQTQQQLQDLQDTLAQSQQVQAQQQVEALQAELTDQQAKEAQLSSQAEVQETAPFDGTFQLKQLKDGTQELRVYAQTKVLAAVIAQDNYSKVQAGAKVSLTNSVTDETKDSTVSFVSKLPLPQKGTDRPAYRFSIPVDDSFLQGQIVHFKVPQKGLEIPKSSVKKGQVYLVNEDRTVQQVAVTGHTFGKKFIVSKGLTKGAKIISHPKQTIPTGSKIHEK